MKYVIVILLIAGFFVYSHQEEIREKFKPRKTEISQQEESESFVIPFITPAKTPEKAPDTTKDREKKFQLDILERNENVAIRRLNELLRTKPALYRGGVKISEADRRKEIERKSQEIFNLRIYLERIKQERNKILNQ